MVGEGETVLRHGGHQSPGQAEGGPWSLDEKKSGWSIIDESIVYYLTFVIIIILYEPYLY